MRLVSFTPEPYAAELVTLRYEYASSLRALGILPANPPDRTRLSQRTWFETGQEARYLRSAIGLTMQLQPQLSWQTEVEVRHHATHGGREQTRTESRTQLRYRF